MPASRSPALSILVLLALMVAPALAAEPPPTPEARLHFKAGIAALEGEQWQTAYHEFKSAYAITPRWTILGNLGIAAWQLERDGEAIDAMEQYLARGGVEIDTAEASKVRATIGHLQAAAATVHIEASGVFSVVDTRADEPAVVNEYGPFQDRVQLRLRPGQHTLELQRVGMKVPAWRATLDAGAVTSVSFVLPPPDPAPIQQGVTSVRAVEAHADAAEPSHMASYVLWGAGTAAGIATGGFVLHARGIQKEADRDFARQCPRGATGVEGCDRTTEGSERSARWRTAALGTGIGALGVLVTGTVLYFMAGSTTSNEQASIPDVQPWITGSNVGVRGTF